jgi:glycosyltransferase involved in cell wall biosynthesis
MDISTVVVLNDFCHVQGGASKVALDEAIALAAAGIKVIFMGAVGPVAPALAASGARVICLDQPQLADPAHAARAAVQALWNRRAYTTMRALLEGLDRRRTVVHLHGYTKALTTTPMLAARRAGFAALCTLHDFFSACPNGAFFDYRRQEPCGRTALGPNCVLYNCDKRHPAHKAYRVVRGFAQRGLADFPETVGDYVTLSHRSAELLGRYLPAAARLYALENIIEVPRAAPVEVGGNRELAVLGRLDSEKGVLLAAEAARQAGLPITFIGDGPLRGAVEALGGRVTGWLPAEAAWRALETARCLLFPSLWYETYGLVVSEAAARGIPAIVSNISAAAERVVDGETGWVFSSGNGAALARALAALGDDAAVRAAGQAAYRRFWAAPPDRARHTRQLLDIYRTVLARAEVG